MQQKYTEEEIKRAITSGTTTRPSEVMVLGMNETHALVKWPSDSYWDNGGRNYCSPWVDLVDLRLLFAERWRCTREVWNCAKDKDGRLTPKRIEELKQKYLGGSGDASA